jgi:hypothetical protein
VFLLRKSQGRHEEFQAESELDIEFQQWQFSLGFAAVAHSETHLIAEDMFMERGTDVLVRSPSRCVCRGVTGQS